MEAGEPSQKRYDVFLSALGEDELVFEEQQVESVDHFVRTRLRKKIQTTWRDNGGSGRLSI